MAKQLGLTAGAVKKAAFDLRAWFAQRLREEIRATGQTNADAEEELRHPITVLCKPCHLLHSICNLLPDAESSPDGGWMAAGSAGYGTCRLRIRSILSARLR